jgi:hypothetical protein
MVALYIYDFDGQAVNRIELFNDEKISVTSSIQNFNDIGKLFTDYSQTFTVPASKHNNTIFKHWYESAVGLTNAEDPLDVDFAFDHRIKYYGYIEIDSIPFRDGKFVMQKANKKNNFIESYTINFVGNLVQLKDKFKADKLNVLAGYNELNFPYTLTNVFNRCTSSPTPNVAFPLVGSTRRFEYDTGDTVNDIALLSGGINYRELFPAIRITNIFDYIQDHYGLEFKGEFLNSETFSKLFLYCKNAEEMTAKTEPIQINWVSKDTNFDALFLSSDTLYCNQSTSVYFPLPALGNFIPFRHEYKITINTTATDYNLIVKSGTPAAPDIVFNNLNGNQTVTFFSRSTPFPENYGFRFYISSDTQSGFTFTANLSCRYFISYGNNLIQTETYNAASATGTASTNLNIANYIPDITVNDFLTALVKMFNMVIIPINENTFEFLPLELWYQNGNIIDITKFIQANELEINKPKLFKRIDFKHEKSDNILNNSFRSQNNNQEYGDLFYDNPNSAFTENYEVKTPFEDVMWERTTATNFLTTTMWDKDRNPYTPKPVLMYDNGITDLGDYWYMIDGLGNHFGAVIYSRFSNEIQLAASDLSYLQTLNWGVENSVWNLTFAPNGLYQQFYSNYINNLYNQRTRVVKAKGFFNPYLLTSLKLNDRVIVSNKRYIINTLTTDLTTGEVELELLNDFRDITQDTRYFRFSNIPFLQVDNTEQEVEFIIYKNNYDTFDVKLSTDFLNYTLSTDNDTDILLNVTIEENTTAADRSDFVILEYFENGVGTIIQIPVLQYA